MYLYRKTIINAPTCLTIGNFDGVHLGHLQILKQLQHLANEIPLLTGLLSFHPHPKSLFGNAPQLITPFRQQYQALKNSQCLDLWYLQKFDHLFANQSVEDFIRWLSLIHI
jgi:riboflavin kinase/FMN adenylyltransferase